MVSSLKIPEEISLPDLHQRLREEGCDGCALGKQEGLSGPVLFRGNEQALWGIVGEAPGLVEDKSGIPFCGPAGKLLDAMLNTMKLPRKLQPIIFNGALCRPIAPAGSGKQNLRPQEVDKNAINCCKPYVEYVIKKSGVRLLTLAGNTAFEAFLPEIKKKSFTEVLEKVFFSPERWPNIIFIPIYHPAFLLRKKNNPEAYKPYREKTIKCLSMIQECIGDLNVKQQ